MKVLNASQVSPQEIAHMCRQALTAPVQSYVAGLISEVRDSNMEGILSQIHRFDQVSLKVDQLQITAAQFEAAEQQIAPEQKAAIKVAHERLSRFAQRAKPVGWFEGGVGEKFSPLDRVACYVPGGHFPLVSTALHTVTFAKAAGVQDILAFTPPSEKGVNPAILYALQLAGATAVYQIGGVTAIAAVAYGCDLFDPAQLIAGPGNRYVTEAKRQVYGQVALDMIAGPSEILIIADDTADPAQVAADLLSQAEHGTGFEQAVLVSTCDQLISQTQKEIVSQLELHSVGEGFQAVVDKGLFAFKVDTLEQAIAIANAYAPEHLEVLTRSPEKSAENLTAAGGIFMGPWSPEPIGDFVAGPSHVLPTGGAAAKFSGLSTQTFMRRSSLINLTKESFDSCSEAAIAFGDMEGLTAHAHSVKARMKP